jgi:hypothetical protein
MILVSSGPVGPLPLFNLNRIVKVMLAGALHASTACIDRQCEDVHGSRYAHHGRRILSRHSCDRAIALNGHACVFETLTHILPAVRHTNLRQNVRVRCGTFLYGHGRAILSGRSKLGHEDNCSNKCESHQSLRHDFLLECRNCFSTVRYCSLRASASSSIHRSGGSDRLRMDSGPGLGCRLPPGFG